MDRQHNHADFWKVLRQTVRYIKSTTLRHGDIEQHEIWLELFDQLNCFFALSCFTYYHYAFDLLYQRPNTGTDKSVIVSDKHTNRFHLTRLACLSQLELAS